MQLAAKVQQAFDGRDEICTRKAVSAGKTGDKAVCLTKAIAGNAPLFVAVGSLATKAPVFFAGGCARVAGEDRQMSDLC